MKNKRKVIVNVERLEPYFSSEFSDLVESNTNFSSTVKKSPENNKEKEDNDNAQNIPINKKQDVNEHSEKDAAKSGPKVEEKSKNKMIIILPNSLKILFSSHLKFLPHPLLKRKGGDLLDQERPLPPFYFQNKGGISRTRSQMAKEKEKMKEKDEKSAVSSLVQNSLIRFEKCVNKKHTKFCLHKALNFLKGGIFI